MYLTQIELISICPYIILTCHAKIGASRFSFLRIPRKLFRIFISTEVTWHHLVLRQSLLSSPNSFKNYNSLDSFS